MATTTLRFLTAIQIQRLHATSVMVNGVLSQPGMLESAVASPMNMKHYTQEQDVFKLAANLAEKIMKNHAYQDGNKRTALLAADMFLKINGYALQTIPFAEQDAHNQPLANAHVAVVTNQWTVEQLGAYYQSVAKPLSSLPPDVVEYRNGATEY
ncbi:type II toxin-antitoxin system death-on-curing family toxin [Aspergillus stella-maris]|uniref:type II toxin-antitoxin system death-on-curing family toxin n=1 Tax=Aspergillus stella-maris TaxID=1810926 RepID=UPI003CCCFBAE